MVFDISETDVGRYVRRKSTGQIGQVQRDPGNGWLHPSIVYEWRGYRNDLEYVKVETEADSQNVVALTPVEQATQWERMSGERLSDAERQRILEGGEFVPPHMRSEPETIDDRTRLPQERFEDFLIIYEAEEHIAHFEVVKVNGVITSPTPGVLMYAMENNDSTEDLNRAAVFLHGEIKWDGCSNWYFDEQDEVMLHFCGRHRVTAIWRLMDRMYDIAAEKIALFDKDLAR